MNHRSTNLSLHYRIPALIIAALLMLYLFLRAWKIPVINDEAITFFYFVLTEKFIPYNSLWDANNHILNSFLAWLSNSVFGDHVFFMRLPSVLMATLYFYFTWKISLLFDDKRVIFLFLCGMWMAHGVIEFMALARGYGMSLGLLAGSIWYLCRLWQTEKTRYVVLSALFMFLATLANLTLLITMFLVFSAIIALLVTQKKNFRNIVLTGSLLAGITILFILYSFELRSRELLYWGSLDSFYDVTIRSLSLLLTGSDEIPSILLTITGCISLIIGGIAIIRLIKTRLITSPLLIFPLLFILNFAAIFLMALLLKVNYPHDRTGLYLIFLLTGSLCFAAQYAGKHGWFLTLPLILFPLHAIFTINLSQITNWPDDLIADEIPDHIISVTTDDYQPTIGGSPRRDRCWNYFNHQRNGQLNSLMIYNFPSQIPDYQLCLPSEKYLFDENYSVILNVKGSDNLLLKRNLPFTHLYFIDEPIQAHGTVDHEYIGIKDLYTENPAAHNIALECDLNFSVSDGSIPLFVIITVFDKEHNSLFYDKIFLSWLKKHEPGKIHKTRFKILAPLDDAAHLVRLYLWNPKYSMALSDKTVNDITISGGHFKAAWLE